VDDVVFFHSISRVRYQAAADASSAPPARQARTLTRARPSHNRFPGGGTKSEQQDRALPESAPTHEWNELGHVDREPREKNRLSPRAQCQYLKLMEDQFSSQRAKRARSASRVAPLTQAALEAVALRYLNRFDA